MVEDSKDGKGQRERAACLSGRKKGGAGSPVFKSSDCQPPDHAHGTGILRRQKCERGDDITTSRE